jgi:hypothetical protein
MSDSTTTIYDLKTLSKKFNISVRILRRYIKKGDLTASKVGRSYYVTDFNLGLFLNLKEVVKR